MPIGWDVTPIPRCISVSPVLTDNNYRYLIINGTSSNHQNPIFDWFGVNCDLRPQLCRYWVMFIIDIISGNFDNAQRINEKLLICTQTVFLIETVGFSKISSSSGPCEEFVQGILPPYITVFRFSSVGETTGMCELLTLGLRVTGAEAVHIKYMQLKALDVTTTVMPNHVTYHQASRGEQLFVPSLNMIKQSRILISTLYQR